MCFGLGAQVSLGEPHTVGLRAVPIVTTFRLPEL